MRAMRDTTLRMLRKIHDSRGTLTFAEVTMLLDEIGRLRDEVLRLTSALGEWERGEKE